MNVTRALAPPTGHDVHFAVAVREFDCVVEQVDGDLTNAHFVTNERRISVLTDRKGMVR
jgi:hypothetical protein